MNRDERIQELTEKIAEAIDPLLEGNSWLVGFQAMTQSYFLVMQMIGNEIPNKEIYLANVKDTLDNGQAVLRKILIENEESK